MRSFLFILLASVLSLAAARPAALFAVSPDAQRYYNLGKAAYNDGAYMHAVSFFEKAIELEPDGELSDDSAYYIGVSYYEDGKYELSIRTCRKFLNSYPDSLYKEKIVFLIGSAYYRLKNYEIAVQNLRNFIKTYPDSKFAPNAYFSLAFSLFLMNKYQSSIDEFNVLNEKYPDSSYAEEGFLRLGQAYLFDKDYSNAVVVFRNFLEKYPGSQFKDEAEFFLARTYYCGNDYSNAQLHLVKYQNRTNFSYYIETLYYLSTISIRQEKWDDALKYLKGLAQIEKDGAKPNGYREEAFYKLGLIYKLKADYGQALSNFTAVVTEYNKSDYYRKALIETAACQILAGGYDEALKTYDALSSLGGEDQALALSKKAELKFIRKDYAGAIDDFNRIISDYKDTDYASSALYWKARCLMNLNRYAEAIGIFETFIKINPLSQQLDEINMFLGNAYAGSGDYDSALTAFNNVLRDYPASKFIDDALNAIAWVYIKKEEFSRAADSYLRIIREYPSSPLVPLAYYSIGIIKYNMKDHKGAIEYFKTVMGSYKDSSYAGDAALKIGWIYYKQENFDVMLNYLLNLDRQRFSPEQKAELYNLMGWGRFRLKDYKDAIEDFQQSMDNSQDRLKILEGQLYISKSYYNMEDYTNAIVNYQKYISRCRTLGCQDEVPAAMSDMAWCWMKLGDNAKALEIYDGLTSDYPGSLYTSEALFKLAEYYYNQYDYGSAIDVYQKIIRMGKGDYASSSLYWTGWCYINKNDRYNAVQAFETYLKTCPGGDYELDVLFRVAGLYWDLVNTEKAKYYYELLIKKYPKSAESEKARMDLSEINLKEQSGGSKEKLYQILIKQSSTPQARAAAMYKLAVLYRDQDRTDEAVRLFQQVVELNAGDESALSTYELAEYHRLNTANYQEAIRLYVKIFSDYKYTGVYPQSLFGLAFCYYETGNLEYSKKYAERLISKYPDYKKIKEAQDLLKKIEK